MSTQSASGYRTGQNAPPGVRGDAGSAGVDPQQGLVLTALREADGEPVSYAQLRARGVELPATIVSELELVGVPIERCLTPDGPPVVAVRLTSAPPEPPVAPAPPRVQFAAVTSRLRDSASNARAAVAAAMIAVVVALAIIGLTASGGRRSAAVASASGRVRGATTVHGDGRPSGRRAPAARRTQPRPSAARSPTAAPPPTTAAAPRTIAPAGAAQLQLRGHDLLAQGEYAGAIHALESAIGETGETLGGCLDPTSQACLTYAYALYDLGRALQLSGRPAEAVTVLEQRLEIDNQRPVVAQALSAARAANPSPSGGAAEALNRAAPRRASPPPPSRRASPR